MKNKKHIKSFNDASENLNISDVSKSYEFLDDAIISTDDFFYDLFDGGYINVDKLLKHKEDIDEVKKAIEIIKKFKDDAEDNDILEYR